MKIYRAGIYARLSVRGSERKAESIENQFLICREFAKVTDDIEIIGCYSDFGKSGMNYDRPGFKRMYEDILAKKIDCVIVKDLSRFGRNHIDTGEFLQKIFPLLGVRFIAVSDGYDSISDMFGKKEFAVNLKNLVNELYAYDIGVKKSFGRQKMLGTAKPYDIGVKVKYAKELKKREGNYLGSRAPYGYKIVYENDIRVLRREEMTYRIVRQILKMYDDGRSIKEIADMLYMERINPPGEYLKSREVMKSGEIMTEGGKDAELKRWNESTIRNIIKKHKI